MRGTLLAAILALAVVAIAVVQARPARAYETYCFDDPVFLIGGQILDVQVQQPVETVLTARSTTLTVIIPVNVDGYLLIDDVSAFPMDTRIERSGPPWFGGPIPVRIVAFVDAALDYPVRLVATQPGWSLADGLVRSEMAVGESNRRVELNIKLVSRLLPPPTATPTATPPPTVTPLPTVTPTVTPPTATPTATATPTRPPPPVRGRDSQPDRNGAGLQTTATPAATPLALPAPVLPIPVLPVRPGAASLPPGR